jgi:hypothetical protein
MHTQQWFRVQSRNGQIRTQCQCLICKKLLTVGASKRISHCGQTYTAPENLESFPVQLSGNERCNKWREGRDAAWAWQRVREDLRRNT